MRIHGISVRRPVSNSRARCIRCATALLANAILAMCLQTTMYSQEKWEIWKYTGERLINCCLDSLSGTGLWFHQDSSLMFVALDSVTVLRLPEKSHSFVGLLIGAAVGGGVGYLIAPGPRIESEPGLFGGTFDAEVPSPAPGWALMGTLLGGVTGYFVGSTMGAERVYDLGSASPQAKRQIVFSILQGTHQ